VRIIVPLSELCRAAAVTMGYSYAREHELLKQSPYPYRQIMAIQAMQKLCLTILRLAKHKPKDRIEVPILIWHRLHAHSPTTD
jgi:hypothetical protein